MLSLESVDLTDVVDLLPMDAAVDLKPVMRVSTTVDAVLTEDLVLDEEALFLDSHWMMELSVSCRKLVARLTSQQGTKTVKISRIQIETAILFRENQKAVRIRIDGEDTGVLETYHCGGTKYPFTASIPGTYRAISHMGVACKLT